MPYYQEPNGDFLYVYVSPWHGTLREGRAVAIERLPSSMCTTSISREYLDKCRKVRKADVPREWLIWMNK